MAYTKEMLLCDIVDSHPKAKDVLLEFGLPCYKCIVAYTETLAEGVQPHDLDADKIIERLDALKPAAKSKK